jgi:predicted metalloprotease
MTFRRDVELDPGQVEDRRGRRVSGGGLAMGGGLGTIIILAALLLFNIDLSSLGISGPAQEGPVGSQAAAECQTGADANERQDCRIVGTVNSLQAYWTDAFTEANRTYRPAQTVLFNDAVNTGCGSATSAVGPFYCPNDQKVYIDLGFFNELENRFGAEGGPFAEEYVLAHEYGHHVQNLLGLLGQSQAGAEGTAVRTELQADCFAGVWAANAVDTGFLLPITRDQVDQALNAASVIGDDRIQEQTQGQVNPETWTHGSAEQRQRWFSTGLDGGSANDCDTFNADDL